MVTIRILVNVQWGFFLSPNCIQHCTSVCALHSLWHPAYIVCDLVTKAKVTHGPPFSCCQPSCFDFFFPPPTKRRHASFILAFSLPAPKIVFNRPNGKKYHLPCPGLPPDPQQEGESSAAAHEDNVKFVYDGKDGNTHTHFLVFPVGPCDNSYTHTVCILYQHNLASLQGDTLTAAPTLIANFCFMLVG